MRQAGACDWGAWDKKYVWHPFTQMQDWMEKEPLILVEGKKATLRDVQGREYIDGNSSIWTNIHGHGHPRINAAVKQQLDAVAHVSFLGSTNIPAIALAERLVNLFPPSTLTRVFYSDNGSTAIESALKMAMQFGQLTGNPRRKFATFDGAYHGDTAGASSLGGTSMFPDRFTSIHFQPIRVRGVEDLQNLSSEVIADLSAVVVEPLVQGTGGMRLWPPGMLRELRSWCDRTGVLLIFDEVLTGFGRTGRMFACEHEGVLPDFMALAKGLSGGFLPLGATLTTEKIFRAFLGDFAERKTFYYGHSYCGNALGCAAALASLDVFRDEKVLASLPPKIEGLKSILDTLSQHPNVGATRQCGMIAGIDLVGEQSQPLDWRKQIGAKVCMEARRHGLLTRPILDTIVLMPPLCIEQEEIIRIGCMLSKALEECRKEGLFLG